MTVAGIRVEGLSEFRAACKAALGRAPTELTAGLKKAGDIPIKQASSEVPRLTGALAGGYKASVRATTGDIVSSVPYAGGAEWGRRGKWSGFPGAPPRYAGKAIEDKAEEISDAILEQLREVVTILGWATGDV